MNVLIMAPRLGHSASCPIITLLHVGFVLTLIPLLVLVLATTLVKSWKNCAALKLEQHCYLATGVSAGFLIMFSMTFTHAYTTELPENFPTESERFGRPAHSLQNTERETLTSFSLVGALVRHLGRRPSQLSLLGPPTVHASGVQDFRVE